MNALNFWISGQAYCKGLIFWTCILLLMKPTMYLQIETFIPTELLICNGNPQGFKMGPQP